jgi:protoporphyrinogen oxidase
MKPKLKRIAVVGAGISGLSIAQMLKERFEVVVFEGEKTPGGLLKCDNLPQGLYHKVGGHVFNTKTPEVAKWFWSFFDKETEFRKLRRNAKILIAGKLVGYPIEDHIYQLTKTDTEKVLQDLLNKKPSGRYVKAKNLHEFLLKTFGSRLCELYFFPYNKKIWQSDLRNIALEWLEGKMPMPTVAEIITANITRQPEQKMVHSEFFYPERGGSQFVVNRLAEGVRVQTNTKVKNAKVTREGKWIINDDKSKAFDAVISTADIRRTADVFPDLRSIANKLKLESLRTRGIRNAFCQCDPVDLSWLYLPEEEFCSNRIIYTGAFSPHNNKLSRMTCVVEFNSTASDKQVKSDIKRLPGNLEMVAENRIDSAYVVHDLDTRERIRYIKKAAENKNLILLGRFAEWEYYNVDKAIEAAMGAASSPCLQ